MFFVFIRLYCKSFFVVVFFIKLCTHESVQDGNVCSIYCLGTVVPTPEICAIVWHILTYTGEDKILKNTRELICGGPKLQNLLLRGQLQNSIGFMR